MAGLDSMLLGVLIIAVAAGVVWFRRRRSRSLEHLLEALFAMRVGEDVNHVMAEMLEQLRGILKARATFLFYYDATDEQLYRWSSDPGVGITEIPPAENPVWIDFLNPSGLERAGAAHPLSVRLEARRLVSVSCSARGNCSRLLVVEAESDPGPAANAVLQRLADLLFSLGERVFLLRRVHARAIDEERDRIARDFHDGPLQSFFSMDVHLQFIRQILAQDPARAAQELQRLQEMARDQGRELREMIHEMRPVDTEGATLGAVVRLAVEGSQKSGGLSVRLLAGEPHLHVPRKVCRQTYQILREALNNARKHARAQHVVVSLEEGRDYFQLVVDDDGGGFKFSGVHDLEEMDRLRIGPVSIKQRARQMGADLRLESTPGRGARLTLRVPVPPLPLRPKEV